MYCLTVQLLLILSPLNLIISVLYNPGDEFPIVISQNTLTTLYSSLQLYYCSLITNVLPTITSFAEVLLSDFVSAVCLFFSSFYYAQVLSVGAISFPPNLFFVNYWPSYSIYIYTRPTERASMCTDLFYSIYSLSNLQTNV